MNNVSSINNNNGYNVSNRYKAVNSAELCERLTAAGFQIRDIQLARVNNKDKQGFQRHLIRASHNDLKMLNDNLRPELVIQNSYDGSQSLRINLGIFRLVCENGLITGSNYKQVRIIHTGDAVNKTIQSLNEFQSLIPQLTEDINIMSGFELTPLMQSILAFKVLNNIIPKNNDASRYSIGPFVNDILKRRRSYDDKNDLFTVLNVIQENALRHGLRYYKINKEDNKISIKKTRAVKSIDRSNYINQLVWNESQLLLDNAAA